MDEQASHKYFCDYPLSEILGAGMSQLLDEMNMWMGIVLAGLALDFAASSSAA
jgi:hypothetical protein